MDRIKSFSAGAINRTTEVRSLENSPIKSLSISQRSKSDVAEYGAIYTPPEYAQLLANWSITSATQKVLDIGVGEGAFTFAAHQRLVELGATPQNAAKQIYGSELDKKTHAQFVKIAESKNLLFPNIFQLNFFETDFPEVDTVLGNPPYVRRFRIKKIDSIRKNLVAIHPNFSRDGIRRTSDLYIYFLIRAMACLKPGGTLAVLTADSWLNTSYGETLKCLLQNNYLVDSLTSFDRRIFQNAQVKPIFLRARRKTVPGLSKKSTAFVRIKNGLSTQVIADWLDKRDNKHRDIVFTELDIHSLDTTNAWGQYFKSRKVLDQITSSGLSTPIKGIATTRIGLQTLAKEFFVLPRDVVSQLKIESKFLVPLAQSSKTQLMPVIDSKKNPEYRLFFCNKSPEELKGTKAFKHIRWGESQDVKVRGKNKTVVGFHNKERIGHARRPHWYDLKTDILRRGKARILIPRLVYKKFLVVWNKAGFVPGELFIEFIPKNKTIPIEVFLAILNSSAMEAVLRSRAQLYGGGTYNISPGQIKSIPMLNPESLTSSQRGALVSGYKKLIKNGSRKSIDSTIAKIFSLTTFSQKQLADTLVDLQRMSSSAKKNHAKKSH